MKEKELRFITVQQMCGQYKANLEEFGLLAFEMRAVKKFLTEKH